MGECDFGVNQLAWAWQTCRRLQNAERTGVRNVRSECRMQPHARMGTIEKAGQRRGDVGRTVGTPTMPGREAVPSHRCLASDINRWRFHGFGLASWGMKRAGQKGYGRGRGRCVDTVL